MYKKEFKKRSWKSMVLNGSQSLPVEEAWIAKGVAQRRALPSRILPSYAVRLRSLASFGWLWLGLAWLGVACRSLEWLGVAWLDLAAGDSLFKEKER